MPAAATQTPGLLDTWGGKTMDTVDWVGPASYVNGTGELIAPTAFGCFSNLLYADGSLSQSGNFQAVCQPVNSGYTQWRLRWFVVSTGLEVANGVNLAAETAKLFGFGV